LARVYIISELCSAKNARQLYQKRGKTRYTADPELAAASCLFANHFTPATAFGARLYIGPKVNMLFMGVTALGIFKDRKWLRSFRAGHAD
jgi:hypothetical protein